MLKVEDVHVSIQTVVALRGLSLTLEPGRMVGLVGRNGAGKTSLMRTVMGHLKPTRGRILFDDQDLAALPAHARAGLGIGYMPEDRGLVPELTVEENILVPVWVNKKLDASERLALVYQVLPELREMRTRRALLLSGGQQKLVALARALAVGTRLLLLDEPFEGVAPVLARRLSEVIAGLKGSQVSVLTAQSDLSHSRHLLDAEVAIERGANADRAAESMA
ncbi:ATP-binding cassette domain-containing protein [Variovorax dokdonensis]|uniref:ATP-binding cassette domain-containing protein n=1 Tax=Variovorax dokdonensis TaxID=344883 RepID=A0ABT7NFI9_9BURK|nr:ATP-binding cassette domain-containing protein [Variovorax dokdonensis]MDM0046686.1 ATP-binding cassette domain-containing protein [Variovorax dokdonensis]